MNIQRILKLSIFLMIFSVSLAAQGKHHHPGASQLSDEIKTALQLTPEQTTQLDQLQLATREKMTELHENKDLSREQMKLNREAIQAEAKVGLSEVLTSDQLKQLRELKQNERQQRKEACANVDKKGLREEIKAYKEQNILPVMKAQRAKLESNLSADEKNSLAEIRTQIREDKRAKKSERQAVRSEEGREQEAKPRGERGGKRHARPGRGHGDRLMGWLKHNEDAYNTVMAIADRHQIEIDELLAEVAPQKEQWRADQKAIKDRYAVEGCTRPEKGEGHRGGANDEERMTKKAESESLRFLLMPLEDKQERRDYAMAPSLSVYPNPATNSTLVTLELEQAARLTLVLTNEKGYSVKTIPAEQYEVGKNSIEIDLNDVPNGTYTLVVKGRGVKPSTAKVVVMK